MIHISPLALDGQTVYAPDATAEIAQGILDGDRDAVARSLIRVVPDARVVMAVTKAVTLGPPYQPDLSRPVAEVVDLAANPKTRLDREGIKELRDFLKHQGVFAGLDFQAEQAVSRALYGVNAARRLREAKDDPKAVRKEAIYLAQHRRAEAEREKSYRTVQALRKVHGDTLSWRALLDDRTTAECKWCHGKNFDATRRPLFGWPGSLHGGTCRCTAGPPIPDAPMISGKLPKIPKATTRKKTAA